MSSAGFYNLTTTKLIVQKKSQECLQNISKSSLDEVKEVSTNRH
jgi:hypothetical protein